MTEKIDIFIKRLLADFPGSESGVGDSHPAEEAFCCYLDGKLNERQEEVFERHILSCRICAQRLAFDIRAGAVGPEESVPDEALRMLREKFGAQAISQALKILLKVKERMIEVINTTGEVLVGQELVAAVLLRSRQIKDFKDEVTILKDFRDVVIEVKISNKPGKRFDCTVVIKKKGTHKAVKDVRVSLFREDRELESYVSSAGIVTFENMLLGKYRIEISEVKEKIAFVALDINA